MPNKKEGTPDGNPGSPEQFNDAYGQHNTVTPPEPRPADEMVIAGTSPDEQGASRFLGLYGHWICRSGEDLFFYGDGFWRRLTKVEVAWYCCETLSCILKPASGDQVGASVASARNVTGMAALLLIRAPVLMLGVVPVIVFGNGTLDLRTGAFGPHSPTHLATWALPADWVPGSSCPAQAWAVIERCYPEGAEVIIRALFRWIIDSTIPYGQAFHLLGPSGSGKGLLRTLVYLLMLPHAVSSPKSLAVVHNEDKVHQYVAGRRLLVFPDCDPNLTGDGFHLGLLYSLFSNEEVLARKLHSSESRSMKMDCRVLILTTAALTFANREDGGARRILTLETLPRIGAEDRSLEDDLRPDRPWHRALIGGLASWALAMPREEVLEVLARRDPAGILADNERVARVVGDPVAAWVDQCLEPSRLGPETEVTKKQWDDMFACYLWWAREQGYRGTSPRSNFQGRVRALLGPVLCVPRRSVREDDGKIGKAPRLDRGFCLHGGLGSPMSGWVSGALSEGGLEALQHCARRLPACP